MYIFIPGTEIVFRNSLKMKYFKLFALMFFTLVAFTAALRQNDSYNPNGWTKTLPSGYYKSWENRALEWLKEYIPTTGDFDGYNEPKKCPTSFYQHDGNGLYYKLCFYADKPQTEDPNIMAPQTERKEIDYILIRISDGFDIVDQHVSMIA